MVGAAVDSQYSCLAGRHKLVASVVVLRFAGALGPLELAATAFYIALSLSNLGSLLESARWVIVMEFARLAALIVAAGV